MTEPSENKRSRVVDDALRAFPVWLGRARGSDLAREMTQFLSGIGIVSQAAGQDRYGNLVSVGQAECSEVFRIHPESLFKCQLGQATHLRPDVDSTVTIPGRLSDEQELAGGLRLAASGSGFGAVGGQRSAVSGYHPSRHPVRLGREIRHGPMDVFADVLERMIVHPRILESLGQV